MKLNEIWIGIVPDGGIDNVVNLVVISRTRSLSFFATFHNGSTLCFTGMCFKLIINSNFLKNVIVPFFLEVQLLWCQFRHLFSFCLYFLALFVTHFDSIVNLCTRVFFCVYFLLLFFVLRNSVGNVADWLLLLVLVELFNFLVLFGGDELCIVMMRFLIVAVLKFDKSS